MRSFALTRRYAFVSLVGVLITAIVLAILYHNLSVRTIIELGERNNVTVATLALNAVLPELEDYLLAGEDALENRAHNRSPKELFSLVRQSLRDTPVDRLKIHAIASPLVRTDTLEDDWFHDLAIAAANATAEYVNNDPRVSGSPYANKAADLGSPCPPSCILARFYRYGLAPRSGVKCP